MNPPKKKTYIKNESASAVRKNAKIIEKSRDDWKGKNQEKADSIRALKTRILETKDSRENWKANCLNNSKEINLLIEKNQLLEKELFLERLKRDSLETAIQELKKKIK